MKAKSGAKLTPGQRLKAFRRAKKLSLRGLAERLGCAHTMVWAMEVGTIKPGGDLAFRIQRETGIPAELWFPPAAATAADAEASGAIR